MHYGGGVGDTMQSDCSMSPVGTAIDRCGLIALTISHPTSGILHGAHRLRRVRPALPPNTDYNGPVLSCPRPLHTRPAQLHARSEPTLMVEVLPDKCALSACPVSAYNVPLGAPTGVVVVDGPCSLRALLTKLLLHPQHLKL